jgi:hypothetical protein
MSDQIGFALGNLVYIICLLFPFIVMVILSRKFDYVKHGTRLKNKAYDKIYTAVYMGLKTDVSGPYHYFSIFLLRKLAYAHIVFYFYE